MAESKTFVAAFVVLVAVVFYQKSCIDALEANLAEFTFQACANLRCLFFSFPSLVVNKVSCFSLPLQFKETSNQFLSTSFQSCREK